MGLLLLVNLAYWQILSTTQGMFWKEVKRLWVDVRGRIIYNRLYVCRAPLHTSIGLQASQTQWDDSYFPRPIYSSRFFPTCLSTSPSSMRRWFSPYALSFPYRGQFLLKSFFRRTFLRRLSPASSRADWGFCRHQHLTMRLIRCLSGVGRQSWFGRRSGSRVRFIEDKIAPHVHFLVWGKDGLDIDQFLYI